MTFLEWVLSISLFTLYVACLFTVCVLTFRKGRYVLGVVGIFFPILWLIGAILPSKYGSSAWQDEEVRRQIAAGK
jgi:hypothetical protein